VTYNVLLIDDQPALLTGLTALVDATGIARVIATATDGARGLALAMRLQPDLVLLDVSMGDESGIDIAAQLLAHNSSNRILGLSAHADPVYVRGMLKAGACGYLLKDNVHAEIFSAITAVMTDRQWIGDGLEI
jgi:DNA-binding NarL/FixJ family response regulator